MSNIENARKDLQISGYVHPTEIVSNTTKKYKTFNTESKGKDYVSSRPTSKYATFTNKEHVDGRVDGREDGKIDKGCPDCGDDALYECDCELKDKQCSKGHVWYINKSGHIKRGDPHENE